MQAHLATIPLERQLLIRYEELVVDPQEVIGRVAAFLGVPYEPALLEPYAGGRMIDGPGDPDIFQHDGIDAALGEKWRTVQLPRPLRDATRELAEDLGYEVPAPGAAGPTSQTLSPAQERLWFSQALEPDSPIYHMRAAYRITGSVDVERLDRAVQRIADRHELLRARVEVDDRGPRLQIDPVSSTSLRIEDHSEADPESHFPQAARSLVVEPFDLQAGPLFRAALIRYGDRESGLIITVHHLVCDAWSMGRIVEELAAAYVDSAEPVHVPARYAEFVALQRHLLEGPALDRLARFWTKELQGPPPDLAFSDRALATPPGRREHLDLTDPGVDRLARSLGVTPFALYLGAYALQIAAYHSERDIVIGVPVANRPRQELESVVGYFVNVLPIRVDLTGDPTFAALAPTIRNTVAEASAHQDLPVQWIAELLELGKRPLFRVMFQHQADRRTPRLADRPMEAIDVDVEVTKTDLSLSISGSAESLSTSWEYRTDAFEEAATLAADLQTLLDRIVSDPHQRVSELVGGIAARKRPTSDVSAGPDPSRTEEPPSDAPLTPWEQVLAEVWRETLQVERVERFDRFFELGGQSLNAMQVLDRVAERTGLRIPPGELFTQTLGQLAASCESRQPVPEESEPASGPPVRPRGIGRRLLSALRSAVTRDES